MIIEIKCVDTGCVWNVLVFEFSNFEQAYKLINILNHRSLER